MIFNFPTAVCALALGQANQLVPNAEKDVGRVMRLLPILQVLPAADFILGGVTLIVIVVAHGLSMRAIINHVIRRSKAIALHATSWRADLLLASAIFFLLSTLLCEIVTWTAVLVYARLIPSWREAGYFVANTYTTLGYGTVVLAETWKMLVPIIAICGLFTFGWTGSVLVDLVARLNRLKDLAEEHRSGAPPISPAPEQPVSRGGPG